MQAYVANNESDLGFGSIILTINFNYQPWQGGGNSISMTATVNSIPTPISSSDTYIHTFLPSCMHTLPLTFIKTCNPLTQMPLSDHYGRFGLPMTFL